MVLKSDGSLLLFSSKETGKEKIDSVQEFNTILPEGEYEGLFADSNKLYALCKNCPGDKGKKEVSVYTLQQDSSSLLKVTSSFKIDLSSLHLNEGIDKAKFHPSCIAKHPVSHEWYIISEIPGVKKEDISISFENSMLNLQAKKEMKVNSENGTKKIIEIKTGSYERKFKLGSDIDGNKIEATYEHGILELKIPKKREKQKQIEIKIK